MSPTAAAGLVGWPRESTPPTALGLFLNSSKHCAKLAAATREENDTRNKRIRGNRMHVIGRGERWEGGRTQTSKHRGIYQDLSWVKRAGMRMQLSTSNSCLYFDIFCRIPPQFVVCFLMALVLGIPASAGSFRLGTRFSHSVFSLRGRQWLMIRDGGRSPAPASGLIIGMCCRYAAA